MSSACSYPLSLYDRRTAELGISLCVHYPRSINKQGGRAGLSACKYQSKIERILTLTSLDNLRLSGKAISQYA
jgi:hypothetical protein